MKAGQKEAQIRNYVLDLEGSLQCTVSTILGIMYYNCIIAHQASEQFGTVYMHNLDDTTSDPSRCEPQPDGMSRRRKCEEIHGGVQRVHIRISHV